MTDHAGQLRAFAKRFFLVDSLEQRGVNAAADEIERLRAALSFYGDHLSYGRARFEGKVPEVIKDGGRVARQALTSPALESHE